MIGRCSQAVMLKPAAGCRLSLFLSLTFRFSPSLTMHSPCDDAANPNCTVPTNSEITNCFEAKHDIALHIPIPALFPAMRLEAYCRGSGLMAPS